MSKIQSIRGMNDILPDQTPLWQYVEGTARQLLAAYGYREIRFPILEQTELFKRSIGEVTDIVEKEMYTFEDRNGDSLTLRPEGTACCVRACEQHGLLFNQSQRLWYAGPMFRHERPQKGRLRQFHQIGVEAFGMAGPDIDAELILLTRMDDMPLRQRRGMKPTAPSPSAAGEEAPQASARNQGTPDAQTATDPKGGRDTTPDSARISSDQTPPLIPDIPPTVRKWGVLPCSRGQRWHQSVRVFAFRLLPIAVGMVPFVAAAATNALASSIVAAPPSDLNTVFTNLRNWLIGLLATLATLMLTLGGLRYLVAGGDPGEVQKAKAALKAAAFGYALAVLAPLFVSILKRVVGG